MRIVDLPVHGGHAPEDPARVDATAGAAARFGFAISAAAPAQPCQRLLAGQLAEQVPGLRFERGFLRRPLHRLQQRRRRKLTETFQSRNTWQSRTKGLVV